MIVACNTASTVLIGQDPSQFSVPVYNVIDPGAKRALSVSRNHRIGVIATNATVAAGSYAKSLKALKSDAVVFQRASPLLVALVEEGWDDDPITNLIIYRYVNPLLANDIDTLILGCTHYPVLRGGISRVVGSFVTLVDSSDAIIDCLHADIEADKFIPSRARHVFRVLATDISPVFATVAARLMAPLTLPTIELVDL